MRTSDSSPSANTTMQSEAAEVVQPASLNHSHDDTPFAEPEITNDQETATEPTPWLRRGDQIFVGVLVVIAIGLMAAHWVRLSGWGMQPVEIERLPERQFDFQLEINSATWVEWMQLEGIGDTLARRIVEDRETNGPFAGIDDLARVKGIGPKTVEKIRPWLRVDSLEEQ